MTASVNPATENSTAPPEAILDLEFEVTADDPLAIGRALYHGGRGPTRIMAILLGVDGTPSTIAFATSSGPRGSPS